MLAAAAALGRPANGGTAPAKPVNNGMSSHLSQMTQTALNNPAAFNPSHVSSANNLSSNKMSVDVAAGQRAAAAFAIQTAQLQQQQQVMQQAVAAAVYQQSKQMNHPFGAPGAGPQLGGGAFAQSSSQQQKFMNQHLPGERRM